MENTFVWKLTPWGKQFFADEWKNDYEELQNFTQEQMDVLKRCLIKGNSIAVREILKLVKNGNYNLQIQDSRTGRIFTLSIQDQDEDGGIILSENEFFGDTEIYFEYDGRDIIRDLREYISETVLGDMPYAVIQSINKIDEDQNVTNLYTKSENCIIPTEIWKRSINKIKENNRLIKNSEKIIFQSFYPHPKFNRDLAKRIAGKTVNQFGKAKHRLSVKQLKRDLKKVS